MRFKPIKALMEHIIDLYEYFHFHRCYDSIPNGIFRFWIINQGFPKIMRTMVYQKKKSKKIFQYIFFAKNYMNIVFLRKQNQMKHDVAFSNGILITMWTLAWIFNCETKFFFQKTKQHSSFFWFIPGMGSDCQYYNFSGSEFMLHNFPTFQVALKKYFMFFSVKFWVNDILYKFRSEKLQQSHSVSMFGTNQKNYNTLSWFILLNSYYKI